MVQKVNKEECVARVYQFLNKHKDWKTEADKNCDNTVCKTEFRAYLLDSDFKFKDGENKKDLIDAFWESIDFKTSGSIGGGCSLNNKNAIDKNESDAIERTIKATEDIIKFMKDKEAPSEITQNRSGWKNSVKEGLIYRASAFLQTHSLEELDDEWFAEAYQKSSTKATADYMAAQLIKTELGDVEGYKSADDENLNDIIDNYVATLEDDPKDEQTVIEEIKKIIAAYIDTAKTNSKASTDLLTDYSYDPNGPLNDLQFAVLTNELTSQIMDYIRENNPDIYSDEYEQQIKDAVKAYVEKYLKDKSADEFNDLKTIDLEEFAKSADYKALVERIKKEQEELKTAKTELINYINTVLDLNDEEKTKAVETVVGSSNKETAAEIVNGIKAKQDVVAMHNNLKAAIDAIDARRKAEEEAREAQYKASFSTLSSYLDQIVNDNITVMTKNKPEIHTEFGMDADGNIVFEQRETTEVYKSVVDTILKELETKNKEAFDAIGKDNIKKLIQASWISAYNKYNSSDSHNAKDFVREVVNQFKKILTKLSENPEYLKVYTTHTAYANSELTRNLPYYGTQDTYGNDAKWVYRGYRSIESDGGVNWDACPQDGEEYQQVMHELLNRIKNSDTYKGIDESILTSVFREAQDLALRACTNNTNDCPYGTTERVDWSGEGWNPNSPVAKENVDWEGLSRADDEWDITPKALVEMTLYYFDKLLYARLAE